MRLIRRTIHFCSVTGFILFSCAGKNDPGLYDNALKARDENDWLTAVTLLENFVKDTDNDQRVPEAKLVMGRGYEKMQQWDRAITVYSDLIAVHARSEQAGTAKKRLAQIRTTGEALRQEGDFQGAARVFNALVNAYPNDPRFTDWQIALGFCSEMAGRWEQAITAYEQFLVHNPQGKRSQEVREKLAWLKPFSLMMLEHFRGAADYTGAIRALETFRKEHPQHPRSDEALFWIAYACEYDQNRPDVARALETYRLFIKEHPDHVLAPQAAYQIGHCLETDLDNPRPEKALAQYEEIIRKHPGTEWAERALFATGHLCSMSLRQYEKAIAAYREVLQPSYYDESRFQKFQYARFRIGLIFNDDLNQPDSAYVAFKTLLDEDPGGWFSGRCWWEMELIRRKKEGGV